MQSQALKNVVSLPIKKKTQNSGFSQKPPSQDFPIASSADLMNKIERVAAKEATIKQKRNTKARALAVKVLGKKKTVEKLYQALNKPNLPTSELLNAVLNVAKSLECSELATAKVISSMAGDKPEGVSGKWWSEELPILLDEIGLTEKVSETERRFVQLYMLENRCSIVSRSLYATGEAVTMAVVIPARMCNSALQPLVDANPYTERTKTGMVVHSRPHQTPEVKALKREQKQAAAIAKMTAPKPDRPSFNDEWVGSYKKPLVVALIVAALALFAEFNQTPLQPQTNELAEKILKDME